MSHVELGIAVDHMDARVRETFARVAVLLLAVTPLRIQHDANVNATMMSVGNSFEQGGVGEEKHLDANRLLRARDGIQNRLGGVVG